VTTNDVATAWRAFAAELGYPVQAGADPAAVADLVARSAVLGGAPPPEFLDLLRDQNGGEVNGLRFFPARSGRPTGGTELPDLVEVNLDMRDGGGLAEHVVLGLAEHVVLGEGCICLRALHLPSGEFHELDRVSLDVIVVHPSFGALMAAAMDAHR
jgi:hypothetical protein